MNARISTVYSLAFHFGPGVALLFLAAGPAAASSVVGSKHDLSVGGSGAFKAASEKQVCIFCHTPHRTTGQTPLWNHRPSTATYTPYSSTTAKATIGQPTGASKLCLSCHDGTVALGMVNSRSSPIQMQGGVTNLLSGSSAIGTDLSDDHPISFVYDQTLAGKVAADSKIPVKLIPPDTITAPIRLDPDGQLQCTACHNPHDNQFGNFLVVDNTGSALCVKCHSVNTWASATHGISAKTWNGIGVNPWPNTTYRSVTANGCENCHAPHAAGTHQRLLTFAIAENNCFSCHDGNVAAKDLVPEFSKVSAHSLSKYSGTHDAAEDPLNNFPRHVSCVDCHNPHASNGSAATTPDVAGPLLGTVGMDAGGAVINPIAHEYELCYRCHANPNIPDQDVYVSRQPAQTNARLEFDPNNASYHPVVSPGKNINVPSLITPTWRTGSYVKCTDCHNNDQGTAAGGTGPNGPHGSMFAPILERQLVMTDGDTNSSAYAFANFALCYKCHSEPNILSDQSFHAVNSLGQDRGHRFHIVDQKAACTTCHDAHGVINNAHLINFNIRYVSPSPSLGQINYQSTGTYSGNCTLSCHGFDHAATSYPTLGASGAAKAFRGPRIKRQ